MFRSVALGVFGLFLLTGCDSGEKSADDSTPSGSSSGTLRGCSMTSPPPVAPGGYYTNGTTVCKTDGTAHLFRGVDRPSMEWGPGEQIEASDFQAMGDWHANVVRVALNQDFWLSGAAQYMPSYQQTVDDVVQYAEAAGLDVILDLHWSDRGDPSVPMSGGKQGVAGTSNQQQMADLNSIQFWKEVALKYQGDGHVLFELYNEPHDISWQVWLNGGTVGGYQAAGMQQLYDAVRGTGANNVVIAGGLDYAFDLTGVAGTPIAGYNVMYASHPYKPQDAQARWESAFGYLATRDLAPVITTEFGDSTDNCTGDWDQQLIQFNDAHHISWTAWAWYPSGCKFPALISDWQHTPTVQGVAVKAALLAYTYDPGGNLAASVPDSGAPTSADGGAGGTTSTTGEGGVSGTPLSVPLGGPTDVGAGGAAGTPVQ